MKKFLYCLCSLCLFTIMASATAKKTVVQAHEVDIGYKLNVEATNFFDVEATNFNNACINYQIPDYSVVSQDCSVELYNQDEIFQFHSQNITPTEVYRTSILPSEVFRLCRCTGITFNNYSNNSSTFYSNNRPAHIPINSCIGYKI